MDTIICSGEDDKYYLHRTASIKRTVTEEFKECLWEKYPRVQLSVNTTGGGGGELTTEKNIDRGGGRGLKNE